MGDTLEQQVRTVFQSLAPRGVASAYLFGSHAAGVAHRDSDVDLAVLLTASAARQDDATLFDARARLGTRLAAALGDSRIDLVVLDELPPTFGSRVAGEGKRVYCADAARDQEFRREAQLRAADLIPFLRRTTRLKREALAR